MEFSMVLKIGPGETVTIGGRNPSTGDSNKMPGNLFLFFKSNALWMSIAINHQRWKSMKRCQKAQIFVDVVAALCSL